MMIQSSSRTCFSLDLGGALSVNSDHHPEVSAALRRIERAYRSSVRQGNLPREAEANAAAPFVRGVERQENVLATILRNAGAVVANLDPEVTVRLPRQAEDDNRGVGIRRCAHRIAQQVEQGLRQQ